MFTRRISSQVKWMFLLVLVPLYFFCGSLIVTAIMHFLMVKLSLPFDELAMTAILNLVLNITNVTIGFLIFKDSLINQWKDFLQELKQNLKYGFLIGPALLYGMNIIGSLITMIFISKNTSDNQALLESLLNVYPIIMLLVSCVLAPIFEEIMFRGMVFGWLYEINPRLAHIVSGFIFGFIHIMGSITEGNIQEWFMIFSYMLMGIVLSYLYEKRNNIYVPIIAHATFNFIVTVMVLI